MTFARGGDRCFLFHFAVQFKKNEYVRQMESGGRRISEVYLEEVLPQVSDKSSYRQLVTVG